MEKQKLKKTKNVEEKKILEWVLGNGRHLVPPLPKTDILTSCPGPVCLNPAVGDILCWRLYSEWMTCGWFADASRKALCTYRTSMTTDTVLPCRSRPTTRQQQQCLAHNTTHPPTCAALYHSSTTDCSSLRFYTQLRH